MAHGEGLVGVGVPAGGATTDGRTVLNEAMKLVTSDSTATIGKIVALLLRCSGVDVNARDRKGESPLSVALGRRAAGLATVLLDAGAEYTERDAVLAQKLRPEEADAVVSRMA